MGLPVECEAPRSDGAKAAQAFPNCLWMPEHLHIFNNALENSIKSISVWCFFVTHLRAVDRFLSDATLRRLFIATCLVGFPTVAAKFATYSGSHVEWRWEYLSLALDKMIPLLAFLRVHLVLDTLLGGKEGSADPMVARAARAALDIPFFVEFAELVRSLGKIVERFTHRLEGCVCQSG